LLNSRAGFIVHFIGNGKNIFSKKIEYKQEEAKDHQENHVVRQSETQVG
jgi:hypothetical protein